MIDANETDWKVMVIDANDPQAATYNNILDVPKARVPGQHCIRDCSHSGVVTWE